MDFSQGNRSPIVLSGVSIVPKPVGEVTIPSQTTAIGERFPREKYIINLVHNMSND